MAIKIVRNDITKMNIEAIVNTANAHVAVGTGCDRAVYMAAGYEELLEYRKEKIGFVPEGDVFITPGFRLQAKYIIHAVSPHYEGEDEGEEEKLRSCYRKSLLLAKEKGIKSIAFPLISAGGFGYPKEEGMRIAVDEINEFLLTDDILVYLVVFDEKAKFLGGKKYPGLQEYIDRNYVENKSVFSEESGFRMSAGFAAKSETKDSKESRLRSFFKRIKKEKTESDKKLNAPTLPPAGMESFCEAENSFRGKRGEESHSVPAPGSSYERRRGERDSVSSFESFRRKRREERDSFLDFESVHESRLEERIRHISDTFSQYLMYLIQDKKMENAEVYKRAIVDKKVFSKIKNNVEYHPQKLTALCLCIGAKLNLDESKDLLARAGYALSPCDKTDIIFSYFIENEIYDMIELDIQLEEHGLPCIIS